MLEPVRPEAVFPDRAFYFPTFSHFLIVDKTSLSLARARALSLLLPSLLAYDLVHLRVMYVVVEYALRTVAWSLFSYYPHHSQVFSVRSSRISSTLRRRAGFETRERLLHLIQLGIHLHLPTHHTSLPLL